ncbi:hypothetical protein [uncultured Methanobrevibacter sp.]|uniref:hypothetical protein n=1 Tax=uncultured Methanobrevibacter sp. TaxID=253161 RepID=UPI0025E007D0|nr:hypothetical protein [uncultured Methanobrevibacter sp.]
MRKILFLILVLFIISSVSAVCAANTTNDLIKSTSDKSIDLSSINDNTYKHVENSNDVLLKSDSSNNGLAKINPENKLDQQQQQQQEPPKSDNNSFIVKKYWEGNYSGSINEIEIQLLKKLNPNNENPPVPELCPPKCKSSYSDNNDLDFLADAVGDIVILPDINGVLTSYKIIKTVKLTKENNWTYVFKNLTFSSARLNGTNHWYLGDAGEYIVREINTPSNVQVIGSSFVKYFTCPVDGGLKVFWNLTNRIPKTENNTTPLNETNENVTTPINITDEAFYEENEDVYVPDKEDNQVTNSSSIYSSPTHENKINTENATGNPIFVLFMIMILSGIVTLRRKE